MDKQVENRTKIKVNRSLGKKRCVARPRWAEKKREDRTVGIPKNPHRSCVVEVGGLRGTQWEVLPRGGKKNQIP